MYTLATGWPTDGGGSYRTNVGYVPQSASEIATHVSYLVTEPVESTVSQIEGYLVTSMLVSSQGELVYASDDCTIDLYADPATLGKGGINNLYLPIAKWAVSSTNPSYQLHECRFSGLVLDSTDVAYFLDGDNKAIHAVQVTLSGLSYLWSVGTSGVHESQKPPHCPPPPPPSKPLTPF